MLGTTALRSVETFERLSLITETAELGYLPYSVISREALKLHSCFSHSLSLAEQFIKWRIVSESFVECSFQLVRRDCAARCARLRVSPGARQEALATL